MSRFFRKLRKFVTGKEEGASMAEYALLLFLITVVLIIAITAMSNAIGNVFNETTSVLGGDPG